MASHFWNLFIRASFALIEVNIRSSSWTIPFCFMTTRFVAFCLSLSSILSIYVVASYKIYCLVLLWLFNTFFHSFNLYFLAFFSENTCAIGGFLFTTWGKTSCLGLVLCVKWPVFWFNFAVEIECWR